MPGYAASDRQVLTLCAATFLLGLALIGLGMILDPLREPPWTT